MREYTRLMAWLRITLNKQEHFLLIKRSRVELSGHSVKILSIYIRSTVHYLVSVNELVYYLSYSFHSILYYFRFKFQVNSLSLFQT